MAIWDFRGTLLPEELVVGESGYRPAFLDERCLQDVENLYSDAFPVSEITTRVSASFPEFESWSKRARHWGEKESNRIRMSVDSGFVSWIGFAIDARNPSKEMFRWLVELCKEYNLLIHIVEDSSIIEPTYRNIVRKFENSSAFNVLVDPEKTLAKIKACRDGTNE